MMKERISPLVVLGGRFTQERQPSWLYFSDFKDVLVFSGAGSTDDFFDRIEGFLKQGYWLCGYFAYEFGYYLEPALFPLRGARDFPLVWLGVCRPPQVLTDAYFFAAADCSVRRIKEDTSFAEYARRIRQIKDFLAQGITYQVNFTFNQEFEFTGDDRALYARLRRQQPSSYTAFIDTGQERILSFSPELFFRWSGRRIMTRPMKGTARRGNTPAEDRKNREWLMSSDKIKAENVMITDMLRNDLGRISSAVEVPQLFTVERYKTLYQMTSTVAAQLRENVTIKEIFTALFPSASVTGAPKIRTMQIIKELERRARGVYTGAIGYISPARQACFNVAIRTLYLRNNRGRLGIGGGIVYDSVDRSEYAEAKLKAKFLADEPVEFSLMESILWTPREGYFLLPAHCRRLRESAEYFSFPLDSERLERGLENLEENFLRPAGDACFKVRVLLREDGRLSLDKELVAELPPPVRVKVSPKKTDSADTFLYHKTTRRDFYEEELRAARAQDFFEVIFFNTRGELTEGAISNVFLEKDGQLYTPPVECGLLPGVLRAHLLRNGRAQEKKLLREDLECADKVYIGNSVRGLREVAVIKRGESNFLPAFRDKI